MHRRLFLYCCALGLVPGVLMGFVTWVRFRDGLVSMHGHVLVVRDYLWLWFAGHLLRDGDVATVFRPDDFADRLRGLFGATLDNHVWSYPPPMLFLAVPAGYLPMLLGFALFVGGQAALFWWVGRTAGLSRAVLVAVLLSPALIASTLTGQNGAMTAALLVGGLMVADRKPLLAGILFGLLTIKPQLGLIVPVCLLASRNWRAIAAAIASAIALALASGLAFGFGTFAMFLANTMPYESWALEQPWNGSVYQFNIVTVFMLARYCGLGVGAAYAVQAAAALVAATLAWRIWRMPAADPALRMAATVLLGLLMTPYALTYDMIAVSAGIAWLAFTRPTQIFGTAALCTAWLWPGLALPLGIAGAPPLGAVLIATAAWTACRHLRTAAVPALATA